MVHDAKLKVAAVLAAVAVLPLAACTSSDDAAGSGDTVTRAASGDLATPGGARRLDGDQSDAIRAAINGSGAKNVIMLLGDGMGDSEITIARNYEKGAGGSFAGLDAFPLTGQYTTYALNKDGKPNYVTDSAASATAWTTGTKTYNGALGIDIKGNPQQTILELAKDLGLTPVERRVTIDEWIDGCNDGTITEIFACGTAAVVTPVGRLVWTDGEVTSGPEGEAGPYATKIREALLAIQKGTAEDTRGWMTRLV